MTNEKLQDVIDELSTLQDRLDSEKERFESLESEISDARDEIDLISGRIEDLVFDLQDELGDDEDDEDTSRQCKSEEPKIDFVQAMMIYGENFQLVL